jgi:hypothetical protein
MPIDVNGASAGQQMAGLSTPDLVVQAPLLAELATVS